MVAQNSARWVSLGTRLIGHVFEFQTEGEGLKLVFIVLTLIAKQLASVLDKEFATSSSRV